MKILRITSLGYVGGGVENGILLMQPILERMGHTVKVLSSNHNPKVSHFSDYEFKALSYQPTILKFLYRCFYPHSYFALRKALREFKPDVVQIHSVFEVSPSVLFLLRKYPTVVTVHGAEDYTKGLLLWAFPLRFFKNSDSLEANNLTLIGWLHYLYHRYLSMPVFRRGFRNVDLFIVFSTYMQEMMRSEGIESTCVPNATLLFPSAAIDTHGNTILYVGRLEKIKGVQHIINALPQVHTVHPNIQLLVAGTGAYEAELKTLVKKLGLEEKVTFLGHLTREQLYKHYRKASISVVPSVWPEPFGKVGIEAMSVGRPVIASDVGGIADWLSDGVTGFLVPPEDPSAIADKLITLFSDRILMQQMSEQAVRYAQNFTVEEHAARIIALYEETIHSHKSR